MIEIGLKHTSELTVTDAVTAIAVGLPQLLLGRDGAMLSAVLYTLLSLALGLIAVIIGYQIVK